MTSGTRTRLDVAFPSAGDECRAWLFMPDAERPPLVILGHGLGATREYGLEPYARAVRRRRDRRARLHLPALRRQRRPAAAAARHRAPARRLGRSARVRAQPRRDRPRADRAVGDLVRRRARDRGGRPRRRRRRRRQPVPVHGRPRRHARREPAQPRPRARAGASRRAGARSAASRRCSSRSSVRPDPRR